MTVERCPWRDYDFTSLAHGPLFFYVGAGLSRAAGLVGWGELAATLWRFSRYYEETGSSWFPMDTPELNAQYLQEFIQEEDSDGHKILSRESLDERAFGRTVILNLLLRHRAPRKFLIYDRLSGILPKANIDPRAGRIVDDNDLMLQQLIWRTHCQGIFTTNYDMLLEEAFLRLGVHDRARAFGHPGPIRSYRYTASFLRFLLSNPRFVLKIHGDINDLETMVFDPYSAWRPGGILDGPYGDDLRSLYSAALASGHVVYLGSGLRDKTFIELHKAWVKSASEDDFERVALIPVNELSLIQETLGSDPNLLQSIHFLTYGGTGDPSRVSPGQEVKDFLHSLLQVGHEGRTKIACPEAGDIWAKICLGTDAVRDRRAWITEPWSVRGLKQREQ